MWVPVLCGLAVGLTLNLAADWLPRRVMLRPDGVRAPAEPGAIRPAGQRLVRWAALLLLSVGLVLYLRSSASASLHPFGEAAAAGQSAGPAQLLAGRSSGLSLPAGTVPELAYCSLLLLIATIDLEHRLVPNVLILAGLILAVGFNLLSPPPVPLLQDAESGHLWAGGMPRLTTALAGAAVGGGIFLLLALARRNALGAGDAKLAFLIGMLTGFPWVLQALFVGILLGGVAAALLLLFRLRGPKQYIPYAPYLVAGAMATLLYGQHIAHWYASLAAYGVRLAFSATVSSVPFRTLETTALRIIGGVARPVGIGG